MSSHTDLTARLLAEIDRGAEDALALARWMSEHPELSLEEHETSARYIDYLENRGFEIERGVHDLETAFLGRHGAAHPTVTVALLAEMDALPEIGHACGHNLSGPASLLAAAALAGTLPPGALRLRNRVLPANLRKR